MTNAIKRKDFIIYRTLLLAALNFLENFSEMLNLGCKQSYLNYLIKVNTSVEGRRRNEYLLIAAQLYILPVQTDKL